MKAGNLMLNAEFTDRSTGWEGSFLGKTVCLILFLGVQLVPASSRQLSWTKLLVVFLNSVHCLLGAQRPLCSQITLWKPEILNMQVVFQRKGCITFFSPRGLGMEVPNSLGNPCTVCRVRPHLAPLKLPQPGQEVVKSLDDAHAICMTGPYHTLP